MKKILSLIWEKTFDHLVSVLIATIFTTSFVLQIFTKIKPFSKLAPRFLMWRWSGWIILVVVVAIWWVKNELTKRRANKQDFIREPPKYHASYDRRIQERQFAGVIWKIFVGSNVKPSTTELSRESVFAWPSPHAYCPECDYELERKKSNWYCMPCRKNYKIPKELQENTWEKIRRNYERLIVQWGYNNFGIAADDHKPFRTILREMIRKRGEAGNG